MLFLFMFVLACASSGTVNAKTKYHCKTKYITTKQYLGKYKITHYCPCRRCCGNYKRTASGTKPKAGRTISVDPKRIKLGLKVKIDNKIYIAEDTGGAIKGKKIDIFVKTHKEALQKGIKYKNVYLIKKKKVKAKHFL